MTGPALAGYGSTRADGNGLVTSPGGEALFGGAAHRARLARVDPQEDDERMHAAAPTGRARRALVSCARPAPETRRRAPTLAALLVAVTACGDTTGPADGVVCGAPVLNPGVSIRSGFIPHGRVALSEGSSCTLRSEDTGAFELSASEGPAVYLVAIQSASTVAGAVSTLRLTIRGPDAVDATASVSPARSPAVGEVGSDAELRLRRNARRALERAGARPFRPGRVGPRTSVAGRPPVVGEPMTFTNSVAPDLDVDCDRTETVTAVVRAVGASFAIAEDVEVAGHITAAEYAGLLQSLEAHVFPVVTAYFGSPADLDANDRVWVLLTAVVNRTTPSGSGTFIAGFFNPSDLSDPATCAASNRGELLYLLAPDPGGEFSNPVEPGFAVSNALGVTAHELEHLLSAEQRVAFGNGSFADLEHAWLGEGLAHIAETAVGFAAADLRPGTDLGYASLVADPDVFAAFHLANFRRAGYHLEDPNGTLALGTASRGDPGGVPSLRMRGFAWLFLRWMADHGSFGGGGILGGDAEEVMFRDLSSGGAALTRGVENVERVAAGVLGSPGWRDLLARWGPAPAADGREPGTGETRITTFDLPGIFGGLHDALPDTRPFERPFPLVPDTVILERSVAEGFDFDLGASTTAYFVLESGAPHPDVQVRLTTQTGADVPADARPQVVLLRTR